MENNEKNFDEVKVEKVIRTDSYFDGKFIEYLGYKILALLISLVSIGIAKPWAEKYYWNIKSTTLYIMVKD